MSMKKIISAVIAFVILLPFVCGCSQVIDGSTEISEPEVSVPSFSSAHEAKRALANLADEKLYKAMYTEEWYTEYREIIKEANSAILKKYGTDEECISACTELYARILVHKTKKRYDRADVAKVFIYTDNEINRYEYVNAKIYVLDKQGSENDMEGDMTIRIRGNSTAVSEKRPYNIKFTDKTSLLGMPEGRKWCLIANHFDKTLLRNKIAFDFSAACGDIAYIKSEYCDVYLNGKLYGSYLLTQPVSDGVLDLDTKNGDFIVERIVVHEGENDFFLSGDAGYVFDTPEREEMSRGEREKIISFMKTVDRAIKNGNENEIRALIDVDSFVSAYLIHELFKDCDMVTGSTYFYSKGGILYAGPIWDMDLSMGNVSHYYDQDKYRIYNNVTGFGNGSGDSATGIWAQQELFAYLMKHSFFADAVKEKYVSMQDIIQGLYKDGGYIDTACQTYGESFARNYSQAGWKFVPYCDYEDESPESSYQGNVDELKDWLSRRDDYLRKNLINKK